MARVVAEPPTAAVSVFGVLFAPDARAAMAELVRVVRPGGHVVLTS